MFKKLIALSLTLLAVFTLTACGKTMYTVTFNTQGGSTVEAVEVEEGLTVAQPDDPTKLVTGEYHTFVGWYTDAAGTTAYNFDDPVNGDIELFAKFVLEVVLSFDTRGFGTVEPALLGEEGSVPTAPAAPTREGYRFAGWFLTKKGLTWLEPEAYDFSEVVSEDMTLYAYWEPVDSKAVTYDKTQSYITTMDSGNILILNPLTYTYSNESTFINYLGTSLYSTVVDWDKAIEEGVADFPGDFSKIENKEFSVEALDTYTELTGAAMYPVDADGEQYLDEDGRYDRKTAVATKKTQWTITIRDDLTWEDGQAITADDYEYTLKQFLDPLLLNYRSTIFYKSEDNQNGAPIVGAYEYFTGTGDWADVGFEVDENDPYTFTFYYTEPVSQSGAIGHANSIRLVRQAEFEASKNVTGTAASYGTPDHPYISYGEYVLKEWAESQRLVFNKNYDNIQKGTITYKSIVVEVVDNIDQSMALFENGDLSVVGLSKDYYKDYAEAENVYRSWIGYPQYLIVNTAESNYTESGHVHESIMFDTDFRQALLYGFDRNYYATSVYAPNAASILTVPLDTKSYNKDALWYSESPQHLQLLADLGVPLDTNGYLPNTAVALFNSAYDRWVAEGNEGAVEILLISDNDEFVVPLIDHIEASYETLFGTDKIDIVVRYKDATATDADIANWDFDLALQNVGFGSSTGIWWQYPMITFLGALIGGGSLGLSQPYDVSEDDGYGAYLYQEVTVDFTTTYEYLEALGEEQMEADLLEGHLDFYEMLKPVEDDPATADVDETKAAGMYVGSFYDLAMLHITMDTPFDGAAEEPYPGATSDTWNMVAAFEALFFEHVPMIPTVTRSNATMYADNVVIQWPAYSSAFGWGTNRYRYLNTDPDFQ
jgi:oligopeptide transport system substrate-binding protein